MPLSIPFLDDMMQQQQAPANVFQSVQAPIYAGPDTSNFLQNINQPKMLTMQDTQGLTPKIRDPRKRISAIDTVGRIADVLAIADDSTPMYTSMQQAQEDRSRQVDMDALRSKLLEQQVATGGLEATNQQNSLLGNAVRGLQAIQARGGDISRAWPILAQQAGIPPERAQQLGQVFAENPDAIRGFSTMLGQSQEYGLQPFYAQGPDGQLQAYQLGKDGTVQPVMLPEGAAPIDPLKFVDTGGSMVGVGSRSGGVNRILPKTEAPGKAADRGARLTIAREGIASRERVAATKGGASGGGTNPAMVETVRDNLQELRGIYDSLDKMGAMVSPKNSAGANIGARVRASGAGQMLEGAVGTEAQTLRDRIKSIRPGLMQSIAKATGMTGKQLDSNADVKLFMQTVTDPASSYEANIQAIKGLERFVAANAKTATPTTKKPAAKGGWSIVGAK